MNILFVYSVNDILSPEKPLRTQEEMQFGISYISALLKKHKHHTRLIVLSRILGRRNNEIVNKSIKEFQPELICFTAVTSEYPFISKTARYIKSRYPKIYLCAGGSHVSLNPAHILSDGFDALCIGEGEYAALELVSQLDKKTRPSGIQNLWIKYGAGIEKNEIRPFLRDIDILPFPDRDMWQEWVEPEKRSRQPILLGRGCPYQCTYCCNHALRKLADGSYVRLRSTESILREIRELITRFPEKRDFYLEVETIGANRGWAMELCSKLEQLNGRYDMPLSFGTNLRITPNADLEPLFACFKKSNFKFIKIGIESGSERIRRDVLKRYYSNEDIVNTASLAKKYGIGINFYNLIGVPGETLADFKETIAVNRACLPDKVFAHIFFPYPGTELYSVCVKEGLLKNPFYSRLERCEAVLDLPHFSKKDIQKGYVWFDYNIYKGRKPIHKIMAKVLVSKCRSNTILHYLYRKFTYSYFFKWLRSLLTETPT